MFLIYKKVKSLFLNRDSFKEKPLRTIFYLIIVFFANTLRLKIKYKANLKKSFFIYTYKPYFNTGAGGTGQFILREYYDEFFRYGHKVLPKKFNFIDIGCSRGFFSMYLLKLNGFKSKGIGIDPLKEALLDFDEVLKINQLKSKVNLINGAISEFSKKKIPIYKINPKRGTFSAKKIKENINKKDTFLTNSYTVDELIFEKKLLKSVEFIKIDTEGTELEILKNSEKTLRKFKPIIYSEITQNRKKILNFLSKKSYTLYFSSSGKLVKYERRLFKDNKNYFFKGLLAIHKKNNVI